MGELSLTQLDLSNNRIGKSSFYRDWNWLDNPIILYSLQTLNLSDNQVINSNFFLYHTYIYSYLLFHTIYFLFFFQLSYFPQKLVKLNRLMVLNLEKNLMIRIPFGIRRLKSLKCLNLSNNRIDSLPCSMSMMLFDTLDVSGDGMLPPGNFNELGRPLNLNEIQQPATLWQFAAKTVFSKR